MRKTILTGLAGCALALGVAAAPAMRSVWDGVYTAGQAAHGADLYARRCAICHGSVLEGSAQAPPLTGEFIPDWAGTRLADLFDKISTTMPLDHPGALDAASNADILAFLLKANGFPAGPAALAPDVAALQSITFDVTEPVQGAAGKRR